MTKITLKKRKHNLPKKWQRWRWFCGGWKSEQWCCGGVGCSGLFPSLLLSPSFFPQNYQCCYSTLLHFIFIFLTLETFILGPRFNFFNSRISPQSFLIKKKKKLETEIALKKRPSSSLIPSAPSSTLRLQALATPHTTYIGCHAEKEVTGPLDLSLTSYQCLIFMLMRKICI